MLALVAGAGVFWWLTQSSPSPETETAEAPLVETTRVDAVDEIVVRQTGFVRPRNTVPVASEIAGRIESVGDAFAVGKTVSEDDLLVAFEAERLRADADSAESAVDQAKAALATAKETRDRQQELARQDYASESTLERAVVDVQRAEARLAEAEAALSRARNALDNAEIRAPFDALVTAESAAIGQPVQPGAVLGQLVDAAAAEIRMGLTDADLGLLGSAENAVGQRVTLRGTGQNPVSLGQGEVIGIDPTIVSGTRTLALIVSVPDPFTAVAGGRERPLRIGELVEAGLPLSFASGDLVSVPPEAVKGADTVWRIAEGTLERIAVDVVFREDDRIVIAGGDLEDGAQVLLSDLPAATDGISVRVAGENDDAAARPTEGTRQ